MNSPIAEATIIQEDLDQVERLKHTTVKAYLIKLAEVSSKYQAKTIKKLIEDNNQEEVVNRYMKTLQTTSLTTYNAQLTKLFEDLSKIKHIAPQ